MLAASVGLVSTDTGSVGRTMSDQHTSEHLEAEPLEIVVSGPADADRILFLLPGFGDRPERFLSRAMMFDPDQQWRIVSPRPRIELDEGTCWYRVDENGPDLDEVTVSVRSVAAAIDAALAESGLGPDRLVLGGFSQGGALALNVALDRTVSVTPRAIAAISPYLLHREEIDASRLEGRQALIVHGRHDAQVEQTRGRAAAKFLERSGAEVTWVDVEGGHHLGPVLLEPLGEWLATLEM
jgi:phospholipase/carboxylesterase